MAFSSYLPTKVFRDEGLCRAAPLPCLNPGRSWACPKIQERFCLNSRRAQTQTPRRCCHRPNSEQTDRHMRPPSGRRSRSSASSASRSRCTSISFLTCKAETQNRKGERDPSWIGWLVEKWENGIQNRLHVQQKIGWLCMCQLFSWHLGKRPQSCHCRTMRH